MNSCKKLYIWCNYVFKLELNTLLSVVVLLVMVVELRSIMFFQSTYMYMYLTYL